MVDSWVSVGTKMSRRTAVGSLVALAAVILMLQLFWFEIDIIGTYSAPASVAAEDPRGQPPDLGQGPRNSTLGFQKIFYISMPQ